MVLHNVYFSGKGTTKACADCIASEMGMEVNEYNWLTPAALQEKIQIPPGGAPQRRAGPHKKALSGRMPSPSTENFSSLIALCFT